MLESKIGQTPLYLSLLVVTHVMIEMSYILMSELIHKIICLSKHFYVGCPEKMPLRYSETCIKRPCVGPQKMEEVVFQRGLKRTGNTAVWTCL